MTTVLRPLPKSMGVPSFAAEFKSTKVPPELQDEIEALNAIYGEDTIEVIRASNNQIVTQVKLPESDFPFLKLAFPVNYPQRPPEVLDFSVKAREKTYRLLTARLVVISMIQDQFIEGCECIFSVLDSCLPLLPFVGSSGLDVQAAAELITGFESDRWLWTRAISNISQDYVSIKTCAICYDEHCAFKMFRLSCEHYFCLECFRVGWATALKDLQPFTCCQKRISTELIQSLNTSVAREFRRYARMLLERDTDFPFFCGFASCSALIGSFKAVQLQSTRQLETGIECSTCHGVTCAQCRMPRHGGNCRVDTELRDLLDDDKFRRCPKCGQGIEKNGGCSHMKCALCGIDFWWQENGDVSLAHLH